MRAPARSGLFFIILAINDIISHGQVVSEKFDNNGQPEKENISFEYECFVKENETLTLGQPHIGLLVSDHVIDQLMTRIFAIFLREQLNYKNVTLIPYMFDGNVSSDKFEEQKLLHILRLIEYHPDPKFSDLMRICLFMSMPPVGHGLIPDTIFEMGPSITPGRFGWFMPHRISLENTHCDIFLDPNHKHYDSFVIPDQIWQYLQNNGEIEHKFISPQCGHRRCVTLLAEYIYDSAFLQQQILETRSFLNVIWLGSQFRKKIQWLQKAYKSQDYLVNKTFIVMHWAPSDVIGAENNSMQEISMPKCENSQTLLSAYCKYEMTPILKYVSKNLVDKANARLLKLLRKFYITDDALMQLQLITQEFHESASATKLEDRYNAIACTWLRRNEAVYNSWSNKETKISLFLGGIFPITTDIRRGHRNVINAARHAVQAINRNQTLLRNYDLVILANDDQCKADVAMKSFLHYFDHPNLLGVLGPACSEAASAIAGTSKNTKMAVISYSAEGGSFIDRETYPYFFRTIGSNRQYSDAYISLMQAMGWYRIAALAEDGKIYTDYISHMETNMKKSNMELIINKKFSADVTGTGMNKHLSDLKKRSAKIIIADIHSQYLYLALCEASKLQMTAKFGYVWFLPYWVSKRWDDIDYPNKCSDSEFQMAFEGHFSITPTSFGKPDSIMPEGISIKNWLQNNNNLTSTYAGFVYDAVWTFAYAADRLLGQSRAVINDLRTRYAVERLVEYIWQTDFEGLSGRVRFDAGGSRIMQLNLMQWSKGQFVNCGQFVPEVRLEGQNVMPVGGRFVLNESAMTWAWHKQPDDGTYDCYFAKLAKFMSTDCENARILFTTALCLFMVLILSVLSFLFWKRQYNRKLRRSAKIMKNFGIDFMMSSPQSKLNALDKWEIAKENVVINRRLGEGAFGTVYGGEAHFSSEGWTAVAVKTLKVGASVEDRLDFLSEAEAMKSFSHKNIVKLLGVCLQSEPIYTIMEFMLYGDLKTYLLARRHMVNEKITDDCDISSKRLTMYAMDVVRGLDYLVQQKFVHRDVACRNCLVNARRVVKLGDFGMARPTYESDYYRFSRKGKMPVRWMSPESLALGLFTFASDIWAYGVVLYEIITFGSFPYQGLTNNQVLQFVKDGNYLQIPMGIKPQLEGLIRACWSQEAKKRPTAAEVIKYISNYPRLLTPILDLPGSSIETVERECDNQPLIPTKPIQTEALLRSDGLENMENVDQTSYTSENLDLSDISANLSINNADTLSPSPSPALGTFAATTPDGYSVMSPLLNHQNNNNLNSNSIQHRLLLGNPTTDQL